MTPEGEQVMLALLGEIRDLLRMRPSAATVAPRSTQASAPAPKGPPTVFPNYGRSAGLPIASASIGDLEFYGSRARTGASEKTGWKAENDAALAGACEAEIKRRDGGATAAPPEDDAAFWAGREPF